MGDNWDVTIDFEDPKLNKIVEENLTESTKEKKAIAMVNAVEQQLDQFEISDEGLANANLLLKMMTEWYGENAKIIEDDGWLLVGEKTSWQEKLKETIGKISKKIEDLTMDPRRVNYNALRGGKRTRRRKRRKRRKRKTRKRKRKKSRKKRKRRRRRTRK